MKKWQYFLLAIFGISIPIVTYFLLRSLGPIYFLIVTLIYVVFTLYLAKKNKDKSARKTLGVFACAGLLIPFIFLVIYWFTIQKASFDYQYQIEKTMMALYPSSIFYMALDGNPKITAIIGVYASAIAVNVLLYSLYGCIFYYFTKLFARNRKLL